MSTYFIAGLILTSCISAASEPEFIEIEVTAPRLEAAQTVGSRSYNLSSRQRIDPLGGVAGLMPLKAGPAAQFQSLFLWGANSESVLVLLDGVPLNDPTSPSGGFDFSQLDWSLIEQVTVIPHGGAVEFGSQALSGVLSLKSRRSRSAMGNFALGSDDFKKVGLSFPWKAGRGQGFASLIGSQSLGFSSADKNDGNQELDGFERWSSLINWQTELVDDSILQSGFWVTKGKNEYDRSGGALGDDPNARSQQQFLTYYLRYSYFVGNRTRWTAGLNGLLAQRKEENLRDLSDSNEFWASYGAMTNQVHLDLQTQLASEVSLKSGVAVKSQTQFYSESGTFGESTDSWRGEESSIFVLPKVRGEYFELSAGARASCRGGACQWIQEAASVWLWPEIHPYVRLAEGLKYPTLYQTYSQFGQRDLRPERMLSSSLGADFKKWQWQWNLNVFQNLMQDQIQFSTGKYSNLAKAKILGGGISAENPSGLSFKYDYLEAKDEVTGLRLLRRPQHFLYLSQVFSLASAWQLGPQLQWRSEREDLNSTSARVILPAYDRLDLQLLWLRSDKESFTFRIENVAERNYQDVWGYGTGGRQFMLEWQCKDL